MFEKKLHEDFIALNEEQDLSQINKKKFGLWEKEFARSKKTCRVLRFVPSARQFYEGGVRVTLWPGKTIHNTANGSPNVTPSDILHITKDGYCPQSREEAIRLLLLSQNIQNRFCLFEDRELEQEAKAAEKALYVEREEHAKTRMELEELRERLSKLEKR